MSIKLHKPKYIKYREGVDMNSEILPSHFLTLIVGRPGCGKSHLLYELLKNKDLYFRKFNFVYFISPSKIGDIELNESICNKNFDLTWIFKQINNLNE